MLQTLIYENHPPSRISQAFIKIFVINRHAMGIPFHRALCVRPRRISLGEPLIGIGVDQEFDICKAIDCMTKYSEMASPALDKLAAAYRALPWL